MRRWRLLAAPVTAAAVMGAFAINPSFGAAAGSGSVVLKGSKSGAATRAARTGPVSSRTRIAFAVQLKLRDLSGAQAFASAVSSPGSASYGKFLTAAQWEARFSPTARQVAEVSAFLRNSGFRVAQVSADRMAVNASGTAAQVEHVFKTSLSYHRVAGQNVRLNDRGLSVPASLAGIIAGVTGIDQSPARPTSATDSSTSAPSKSGSSPPPPPGFRVAPPCSKYYGQKIDTELPAYDNGFPPNPPWVTCGYTPEQFRGAYNLNGTPNGAGQTVAIIDAYAAPTLFADAEKYASLNDPSNPLKASQFSELLSPVFNYGDLCGASSWYGEQTLDVEAVHATAPGAHILYAGAENCFQGDLTATLRRIVDGHLADIVTNSYGDPSGDLLDSASTREATDNVLLMAAGTGISVLFSSGDWEDNFILTGVVAPTYPASSPWATGIGGTTLKVGADNKRFGELGWSTGRSLLCDKTTMAIGACTDAQLGTWGPVALNAASGGGTSYVYRQPDYQASVVPDSLSRANGSDPMRVEPDISAASDPATGMLVGETQTFPNGVYYDQYRIGGTSLASPLTAGIIARANAMAGHALGFLNPQLYALFGSPGALFDILPAGKQDMSRSDYLNGIGPGDGLIYWTRIIDYEGQETFCNAHNECRTHDITLHTAPGYDNMTGLGSPGEQFLAKLSGH